MVNNRVEEFEETTDLRVFVPPHMVQIPLEEYRRYIESSLKGRTVEITLEEYDNLKMENMRLYNDVGQMECEIKRLTEELYRRTDIAEVVKQEARRLDERLNKVLQIDAKDNVSDSVTKTNVLSRKEVL